MEAAAAKGERIDAEVLRELYWGKRLTIRQISSRLTMSRRLVRETLLKLGPLRTPRKGCGFWSCSFSGDKEEKAYLEGLRAGDLNAFRQSRRAIVARVSTTHQAMLELFQQVFAPYGQCVLEPRKVFLTGYDWQIRVQLDNSFEFLIDEPVRLPEERPLLYEFLAGLSDSDGSWCLFGDKGKTACAFVISSESRHLLLQLKEALERECFHTCLYLDRRKGAAKIIRGVEQTKEIKLTRDAWRLDLHRREEVRMLARRLLPLSRHREKIQKMCLIVDEKDERWEAMATKVNGLRAEIREQTSRTVKSAEIEYKTRQSMADERGRRLGRSVGPSPDRRG